MRTLSLFTSVVLFALFLVSTGNDCLTQETFRINSSSAGGNRTRVAAGKRSDLQDSKTCGMDSTVRVAKGT